MKPNRNDLLVSLLAGLVLFVGNYLTKSLINSSPGLLYGIQHWGGGKFLTLFLLSFLIAACVRIAFAFLPNSRTRGLLLILGLFIVVPAFNFIGATRDETLRLAIMDALVLIVALVIREITTPRPEVQALLRKR